MNSTSKGNSVPLEAQEKKEFEQALLDIEASGSGMKKSVQIGIRYAVKAILYRQDVEPINRLDAKLCALESNYYKKTLRSNFAAYCGYVNVEKDSKGQNRYYHKDSETSPVYYSKAKGNKGWKVKSKLLTPCKKVYETYFSNVHFMAVKIEVKEEKSDYSEKMENLANNIKDMARQIRDSKELWDSLDKAEVKAILDYMAAMPNI